MRSVMIWGHTNYSWLWVPLARALKQRHGSRIHIICTNAASVAYWKRQDPDGCIDTFTTTNHFFTMYGRGVGTWEDVCARARQYEAKYEVLMVDLLQADRHLGRGFAAGGIGHPRSRLSEQATYIKSLHACNEAFAFWESYFDTHHPTLLIGMVASVLGKASVAVARVRGIPVRSPIQMRYGTYVSWTEDEYFSFPAIARAYHTLTDTDVDRLVTDVDLTAMRRLPVTDGTYHAMQRAASLTAFAQQLVRWGIAYSRRWARGTATMGNYLFRDLVASAVRTNREVRRFARAPIEGPDTFAGRSFIFYPLHVEPEMSVGLQSPEMNEQLACIELLAKNLPAGTLLVVKEHLAAVGRRPRDFYETMRSIPNVVLISPYAYALDFARSARAVAVITGTLGAEAAMLGIPVISFGLHNEFNFLPHVHVVESWTALRPLLAQLCGSDDPAARALRERDGRRYLAALKACSVDFSWSNYGARQRAPATDRELSVLLDALSRTLA